MATSFGYGKKTFIQGLARLSCHLAKYIVKYNKKLQTYLPAPAYTCLASIAGCLTTLCNLLNSSDK